MIFSVLHQKNQTLGTLEDSIYYMCTLGAVLAKNAKETGLQYSMMNLQVEEFLTLEDAEGKEIKVTRFI